jgi:hypothetical protein
MPVYMVERSLPGIEMDQLAAAQKAAIDTSEKFIAEGKDVRYIRTTFVPGEAHCMCLFEASNDRPGKGSKRNGTNPFHEDCRSVGSDAVASRRPVTLQRAELPADVVREIVVRSR